MTASTPVSPGEVEILLFGVGGSRYGVHPAQVLRLERPSAAVQSVGPLGSTLEGTRVLVFRSPTGAGGQLKVDVVHGIRTIPIAQLRRLPVGLSPHDFAIGVWLDGNTPVLLVDLAELAKQLGGNDG